MCDKAPEYYDEIQTHIQTSAMAGAAAGGGASGGAPGGNDFWWDVAGWVLLATCIVGAMALARNSAKPA